MSAPRGLAELQEFLRKNRSATALEIAKGIKCSVPTVYRRIRKLKDLGASIAEVSCVRERVTGPDPTRFVLLVSTPRAL